MGPFRYNPDIHRRQSIRLSGYDYASGGAYFVTVCSQSRECLFGDVVNGVMELNDAGLMVQTVWDELPDWFSCVRIDHLVIMPNHIHGIIMLNEIAKCRGKSCIRPVKSGIRPAMNNRPRPDGRPITKGKPRIHGDHKDRPYGTLANTLGRVIQAYKSITTHRYIRGVNENHWPSFNKRLWQRNYYEHVIRNENDLMKIREYIDDNPAQWEIDENNPGNH